MFASIVRILKSKEKERKSRTTVPGTILDLKRIIRNMHIEIRF